MNADRGYRRSFLFVLMLSFLVRPALADELWVAPTYQQDFGLGVGFNAVWPVTSLSAVRLAFGVPNDLQALQAAKLVLIPEADVAATVWVMACSGQDGEATSTCAAWVPTNFIGISDRLTEVDISTTVTPHLAFPGTGYVALTAVVLDQDFNLVPGNHVLGLRLAYDTVDPPLLELLGSCPAQQLVVRLRSGHWRSRM